MKLPSIAFPLAARLALLLFFVAQPAFAQDVAPFQGPLDWLISVLTGGFARSAAVLVVIVLGYMCFIGRMSWDWGGRLIGGIALIFGGATLADLFIGQVGG